MGEGGQLEGERAHRAPSLGARPEAPAQRTVHQDGNGERAVVTVGGGDKLVNQIDPGGEWPVANGQITVELAPLQPLVLRVE